jgi:hypothetical protein
LSYSLCDFSEALKNELLNIHESFSRGLCQQ